jgi:hypothetical protein
MEATDWPKAFAVLGIAMMMIFVASLFIPLPWIILAQWAQERAKTNRILAEARLLEARRALDQVKGEGGWDER